MAVLKCKMCGGDLSVTEGMKIVECDFCGTTQTVPNADNEKKTNLFNRANRLRIASEFDRATGIYESIIAEFPDEAEAYWGLCLCKYGIEYVDDPRTAEKIPTCHRTSFESIFNDSNYNQAIACADSVAKSVYEKEAKGIDTLQKDILSIANKEGPFDIFICYKETDELGNRTIDSVLAQDIYEHLTEKGFKVFFARITLEGILGSKFEPYIFAALNSAKVMLAIGTDSEYYNAVWVKNEWSRYLSLMQNDRSKTLIPCYKDMDPYDMPQEFKNLQGQDMGKIGFMQDLTRGITKIIPLDEPQVTVIKETVVAGGNANTEPLLKRAFMFLEDGDFESADEYCEKVLDMDPECAQAYLGKLMAELKVRNQENLKEKAQPFDRSINYQKAVRFGDEKLQKELAGYIEYINTRNENARLEDIYQQAVSAMEAAKRKTEYLEVAKQFKSIGHYKDSSSLEAKCLEKAEEAKRKAEEEKKICNSLFEEWKAACKNEKEAAEKKNKINKEIGALTKKYNNMSQLKNKWSQIEEEIATLNEEEKTAQTEISKLNEEQGKLGFFSGKRKKEIIERIEILEGNNRSLREKIKDAEKQKQGYSSVNEVCNILKNMEQEINTKKKSLEELSGIRSSSEVYEEIMKYEYSKKLFLLSQAKIGKYVKFGTYMQSRDVSDGKEDIEWLVLDVKDGKALVISKYGLGCKPYNSKDEDVTWETCTLRQWLNGDFLKLAFSEEEQGMIPAVTVTADKNPDYDTNPGNDTQDQVFLLSIPEVNKYFGSDKERQCEATTYAKEQKADVADNGNSWWWLRSPGDYQSYTAFVLADGGVNDNGYPVDIGDFVVRPALWIDLNP